MSNTIAFIGSEELAAGFRYTGVECFIARTDIHDLVNEVVNSINPFIIILEESLASGFYDDVKVMEKKFDEVNFVVIPAFVSDNVERKVDLLRLINEALGVSL